MRPTPEPGALAYDAIDGLHASAAVVACAAPI